MSMTAGTDVAVSDAEVVSGTGAKREYYDAEVAATTLPALYTLGQTTAPFSPEAPATQEQLNEFNPGVASIRLSILRGIATRANAFGAVLVAHVSTNAKATIGTTISCGRTPTPNDAGAAIVGPAVAVELAIS
jgi:hypothetical protein